MSPVLSANTAGGTHVGPGTARARLGTPGRLNYAEHRSDSNTISNLCTLSAAPKLGSASARASEVSVKTLTLTPQQPTPYLRCVRLGIPGAADYVEVAAL